MSEKKLQLAKLLAVPEFNCVQKWTEERTVTSVYCCDLLSIVMGKAPANCAWITVMGNVNAIAVALLADISCIVLAEGASLQEDAQIKAQEHNIAVLKTTLPVFEAATKIGNLL